MAGPVLGTKEENVGSGEDSFSPGDEVNKHKSLGSSKPGLSGRDSHSAVLWSGDGELADLKDGRDSQHLVPVWPHPG